MENQIKAQWLRWLGKPQQYDFAPCVQLLKKYDHPDFDGELYFQANGPDTVQRVLMLFPKNMDGPVPGVIVPFYFPEAMLGFEPETGEQLPFYAGIEMMLHLVRRGYAVASADAYHLTYLPMEEDRGDFTRWSKASQVLLQDHPGWTGMGKLVADTWLLTNLLADDPRVDNARLGIAGHSLGGKMAFYNGCLDERIRVILASDFGIGWEQSNWEQSWYWGDKLKGLQEAGMEHSSLLGCSGAKPFCLLAGKYDDDHSWEIMQTAPGYTGGRLKIVNHASGHRPSWDALCQGYDFLDTWLK